MVDRAPLSESIFLVVAPFFLPKLALLIDSFPNATDNVRVLLCQGKLVCFVVNYVLDGNVLIFKISFPNASFYFRRLIVCPLMLNSFFQQFLIFIGSIEFCEVGFQEVYFYLPLLHWKLTVFVIFLKQEIVSAKRNIHII